MTASSSNTRRPSIFTAQANIMDARDTAFSVMTAFDPLSPSLEGTDARMRYPRAKAHEKKYKREQANSG